MQSSSERKECIYKPEHYLPILERKGRAILFAKPVHGNVSEEFLTQLKKQNLRPKQICYLLHQCLEHGCTAVMNGELPTPKAASVADPVHVDAVDLSAYDYLCSSERCSI